MRRSSASPSGTSSPSGLMSNLNRPRSLRKAVVLMSSLTVAVAGSCSSKVAAASASLVKLSTFDISRRTELGPAGRSSSDIRSGERSPASRRVRFSGVSSCRSGRLFASASEPIDTGGSGDAPTASHTSSSPLKESTCETTLLSSSWQLRCKMAASTDLFSNVSASTASFTSGTRSIPENCCAASDVQLFAELGNGMCKNRAPSCSASDSSTTPSEADRRAADFFASAAPPTGVRAPHELPSEPSPGEEPYSTLLLSQDASLIRDSSMPAATDCCANAAADGAWYGVPLFVSDRASDSVAVSPSPPSSPSK
mmetsp:Transcript_18064/g.45241  ORF Transcript_18064/g.45241 Transcript_18064/m.45241 type:complete len:311 (-) Transcript_18064:1029-1961(-)